MLEITILEVVAETEFGVAETRTEIVRLSWTILEAGEIESILDDSSVKIAFDSGAREVEFVVALTLAVDDEGFVLDHFVARDIFFFLASFEEVIFAVVINISDITSVEE